VTNTVIKPGMSLPLDAGRVATRWSEHVPSTLCGVRLRGAWSHSVPGASRPRHAGRLPIAAALMVASVVQLSVAHLGPVSLHAEGIDTRLPRVLNHRGESVANLKVWVDAVQSHAPNATDTSVRRVEAWTSEQLRDTQIELVTLLTLIERPQQRSFTFEDTQFQRTDVLYTAGELDTLRELALTIRANSDAAPSPSAPSDPARTATARNVLLKPQSCTLTSLAT
jgi:hypothetical protein